MSQRSFESELKYAADQIPMDFGGGCSAAKGAVLASLIKKFKLKNTVDIGVYRGRSLFPQAIAHKWFTGGMAFGIDPWSVEEAHQHNHDPNLQPLLDEFAQTTDWNCVFDGVEAFRRELNLTENCTLLRQTSAEAVEHFRNSHIKLDLVHIDGNHDADKVMQDVELYMPMLQTEGFIVLDDISWDSVKPVYQLLSRQMKRLLVQSELPFDDYAVFRQ